MPVSLSDIAKKAHVSVKTVSGALHGGDVRMSAETRERIASIARDLGYVPNLAARGMRQGWMPIISVISDHVITTPFATAILRSFDEHARVADKIVVATPTRADDHLREVINEARRLRPMKMAYAAMYHKAVTLPADCVSAIDIMINCYDVEGEITSLVPDEKQAGYEITRYLIDHGRTRIAYINLPGLIAGELRLAGHRKALNEAKINGRPEWVLPAVDGPIYSDDYPSCVNEAVGFLLSKRIRPDAILCGNDRVAMEVYAALARHKLRIPHDIAVASFDDQTDISTRLDPGLTTMALPHAEMGALACDLLLSGKPKLVQHLKVPFSLVERSSV